MTTPKSGPLTLEEFRALWRAAVDHAYAEGFEQAGEGNGIEAFEQAWQQFARVSQAIDATTQALYILPWSGQTAPPAGGAARSTVVLTIDRTLLPNLSLVFPNGALVGESAPATGSPEGIQVLTGRRYSLDEDVTFVPGDVAPKTVTATAERPGKGYDNPRPGTIVAVDQPGARFSNTGATVRATNYPPASIVRTPLQRVFVVATDRPDVFLPDHVGRYLQFVAGANAGKTARIIGYSPPDLAATPPTGGTVEIELVQAFRSNAGSFAGTFQVGETLTLKNGAAVSGFGILEAATPSGTALALQFRKTVGRAVTSIVGDVSGATATISFPLVDQDFTLEIGTASWVVLDWALDFGLTATNAASPTGGRAAMLDALGDERAIPRAPGESDDSYRARVAQIADVVTPNAIRRTLRRTVPGVDWCFREVGSAAYPGFFYDVDFYDYDELLIVPGVQVGVFGESERVRQVQADGTISLGIAISNVGGTLVGITDVWRTFVAGLTIVGETSGSTATPAAIVGGLRLEDRRRVYLSFEQFRGWFFVGLPPGDVGDPGFAYDDHPRGAYDGRGYLDFYDGAPFGTDARNLQVQAAIDAVRAAGVGFSIYLIRPGDPCP